jgi:hypothetical protein
MIEYSIVYVERDIYLFTKKNHLDIFGFHINDFDTGAVTGIGDAGVSFCVVFKSSGTEIDRLGNSLELLSPPDDDG